MSNDPSGRGGPPGGFPPPPPYGAPPPGYPPSPGYSPPQQQGAYGAPQPGYPPPPPNPYAAPMPMPMQQAPGYGTYANPNALKKDTAILLCAIAFMLGFFGIHRFYLKSTGIGVLYFFTLGGCFVGQIIDLIQLITMTQQEFDRRYNSDLALPP